MGPKPQVSINWAYAIFSFILLLGASFPAQADTTEIGTNSAESANNFVYLPFIRFGGDTYYVSPLGNDNHSGKSPAEAWATFDRAWDVLQPGDVLTLLDGVYNQSLHPKGHGTTNNPITIRAQNDGRAIIDGQGVRIPVSMDSHRVSYFVVEGIVAQNSSRAVFHITADHIVLRRISGYNANTDENVHVINISGDYNLVEDCVASGTGRKMILVFHGNHNVIRRCLADWRQWDGRNSGICWPWGEGIQLYTSSNNIIENSISYGHTPRKGISVLSQGGSPSNGNKILGTMAISSGMKHDGTPMVWGDTRPQPTQYTCVSQVYQWQQFLYGFGLASNSGILHDNLLQDIFAWGNARYGLSFDVTASNNSINNNRVNRATIFNNGLNNPLQLWGGMGVDAWQTELLRFDSIDNSYIETVWNGGSSYTTLNGEGARLTHRYVNGVLTNEPLWPWPMEERIQAELGYSVTNLMTSIIP